MPKIKITKLAVEKLPPVGIGEQVDYFDTELKGFGVRASSAAKTYFVMTRVNGRKVRYTIGKHNPWTAEKAREEAKGKLMEMGKGENPSQQKRTAREVAVKLGEVFEKYLEVKRLAPNTIDGYKLNMKNHFADWQKRPINEITTEMIVRRHAEIGEKPAKTATKGSEKRQKGGKTAANVSMSMLRSVFNFAMVYYRGTGVVTENPVRQLSEIKAWYEKRRRQTIVRNLAGWHDIVMGLENRTARDCFLLLLFTGMRKKEALRLQWPDVDLENKILLVRDTKNKDPLEIPLSNYLYQLLKSRKEECFCGPYVFPACRSPKGYFQGIQDYVRIMETGGVKFMVHDLRRTFITTAESLDISPYAVKRLINHRMKGDVTAGYIVHDVERLRVPMQKITGAILAAIEPKQAKVIPLRTAEGI